MAVTLADFKLAVDLVGQSVGLNLASPRAQTHGAAKFFHAAQLAQLVDHSMRRRLIELARIRIRQSYDIAGKLHASGLHSQANAKVRNLILTGVANRDQHPFNSALAKTARNQQPVITFELRFDAALVASLEALGLNPVQLKLQIVRQRTV